MSFGSIYFQVCCSLCSAEWCKRWVDIATYSWILFCMLRWNHKQLLWSTVIIITVWVHLNMMTLWWISVVMNAACEPMKIACICTFLYGKGRRCFHLCYIFWLLWTCGCDAKWCHSLPKCLFCHMLVCKALSVLCSHVAYISDTWQ